MTDIWTIELSITKRKENISTKNYQNDKLRKGLRKGIATVE